VEAVNGRVPVFCTVAGSDPSGGAGVQADIKTASALGVYAAACLTSLTVQDTRGVRGVHAVPGAFVAEQLSAVLDDLDVRALKIGMVATAEVAESVARVLESRDRRPLVVLDPVMVATSGDLLLADDAVAVVRERLLPLADLVTPNAPEAAALLGIVPDRVVDVAGLAEAGRRLVELGASAALVKGGHLGGPRSVDVLVDASGTRRLSAERVDTPNSHGTGCTLASAVAARLVHGDPVPVAVDAAKRYLTEALRAGAGLTVGHGSGPVAHFHAWWS
jgi:hydroxymethylpyrimidine/phosphomethylpyrimidine kinase